MVKSKQRKKPRRPSLWRIANSPSSEKLQVIHGQRYQGKMVDAFKKGDPSLFLKAISEGDEIGEEMQRTLKEHFYPAHRNEALTDDEKRSVKNLYNRLDGSPTKKQKILAEIFGCDRKTISKILNSPE